MLCPMTKTEFDAMAAREPYFLRSGDRWEYFKRVIELAQGYVPETLLEIGPHTRPLFAGSHTMGNGQTAGALTYVHDIRSIPWPCGTKNYDVVIACQVWEHLRYGHAAAFQEACRVGKVIILTFPYHWNCPYDPLHHDITNATIRAWTGGKAPLHAEIIGEHARFLGVWLADES